MQRMDLHGAFYDWLQGNQLSSGQIALWHAIVHMAMRTGQERIRMSGIQLVQNTGLSYEGVKKARNVLKQHGLIDFTGGKGRSTEYRLLPLPGMETGMQDSAQLNTYLSTQPSTQLSTEDSAIVRANNNPYINNNLIPPPPQTPPPELHFATYVEGNLRGMTPGNWDALRTYLEDGMTTELVMRAVDEAAAQGKRSWAYVRSILDRWMREGVTSVEMVDEERRKPDHKPQKRQIVRAPEGY